MKTTKREKLTLTEQLLLDSLEITAICPKCGRAVLVNPKNMYWVFGVTIVHEDGSKETHEAGWQSECKCGYPIPVKITMKANEK